MHEKRCESLELQGRKYKMLGETPEQIYEYFKMREKNFGRLKMSEKIVTSQKQKS